MVAIRNLPPIEDMAKFLNKAKKGTGYTIEKIEDIMKSQAPHHWFSAESYPTKEDWLVIKALLRFDDTYDEAMTKEFFKPAEKMNLDYTEIGLTDCGCNAEFDKGVVLDIFAGSGTTAEVAKRLGRKYIMIEINPEYVEIMKARLKVEQSELFDYVGYNFPD